MRWNRIGWALAWVGAVGSLTGALSCGRAGRPKAIAQGEAIVLTDAPFAELSVPPHNRPTEAPPPATVGVKGPFRYIGATRRGMHRFATEMPIRPRGLFFHRPQPGMKLTFGDTEVRYDRFAKSNRPTWAHDRHEIVVFAPDRENPPDPAEFALSYPRATEREAQLNHKWSGKSAEDFVRTTIQDDWDNRRGLLLPAPAVVAWDIAVPAAGELTFTSGLVEPEIKDGEPSDGAILEVEVEVDGKSTVLHKDMLAVRSFEHHRVDLSAFAGRNVRLRMRTSPGASTRFDYAFIAAPVLASRKADPVRVVMVFIDTLRPDHMSLYGYERDTTASIDRFARSGTVFRAARTVAPWTLPSARSIVTGRQPEYYDVATTLQETLRKRGFATAFFAGNVYLSVNFDMHRDWDFHRVGLWPLAQETTDDALKWLEANNGRDALLQVHYMGTHLPYVEPPDYRHKYAGEPAGGLREEFHLSDVRKAGIHADKEGQRYVKDRYDNNVRYVTDQVARITALLDDNDVLLLYSDHGEEFWDHNGFEHGHTLYEELLHVPMVIKGPGVVSQVLDTPVSLLDLTPTVLDFVGALEADATFEGRSLVPLLRGTPGAAAALGSRDFAFGRPLYGSERWGVLHEGMKWTTHEGKESLHDLGADPGEDKNLAKGDDVAEDYLPFLEGALGRKIGEGYRLAPTPQKGANAGLWVLCSVPGGFSEAWKADDPLENSEATVRTVPDRAEAARLLAAFGVTDQPLAEDAGAVEICWHGGHSGSREVYLLPARPLAEVGHQMVCSVTLGDGGPNRAGTMRIAPERDPGMQGPRTPPLARLSLEGRQLTWQYGIAPIPSAETQALSGRDDETNEMLEAMGYVDPDKPKDPSSTPLHEPPAPVDGIPCPPPKARP